MSAQRRPLAAVYVATMADADAWAVAETPTEARDEVQAALEAGAPFAELTLANRDNGVDHRWNGRTVYVRAAHVTAIGPPLDDNIED